MKKITLAIAFCLFIAFSISAQLIGKQNLAYQYLLDIGYSPNEIEEYNDFFMVQGDVRYSKNIHDYPNSYNVKSHRHDQSLVADNKFPIKVFSHLPNNGGAGGANGTSWSLAFNAAIGDWNNSNIRPTCGTVFVEVANASQADIVVIAPDTGAFQESDHFFGWVNGDPYCGNPWDEVWINTEFIYPSGDLPTQRQMRNIVAHELGHAIGFKHIDSPDGIAIPFGSALDSLSIMHSSIINRDQGVSGLIQVDIDAVNHVYGCNSTVNDNHVTTNFIEISETPSAPICPGDTFDIRGNFETCNGTTSETIELYFAPTNTSGAPLSNTSGTFNTVNNQFSFLNLTTANIPGYNPNETYSVFARIVGGNQSPAKTIYGCAVTPEYFPLTFPITGSRIFGVLDAHQDDHFFLSSRGFLLDRYSKEGRPTNINNNVDGPIYGVGNYTFMPFDRNYYFQRQRFVTATGKLSKRIKGFNAIEWEIFASTTVVPYFMDGAISYFDKNSETFYWQVYAKADTSIEFTKTDGGILTTIPASATQDSWLLKIDINGNLAEPPRNLSAQTQSLNIDVSRFGYLIKIDSQNEDVYYVDTNKKSIKKYNFINNSLTTLYNDNISGVILDAPLFLSGGELDYNNVQYDEDLDRIYIINGLDVYFMDGTTGSTNFSSPSAIIQNPDNLNLDRVLYDRIGNDFYVAFDNLNTNKTRIVKYDQNFNYQWEIETYEGIIDNLDVVTSISNNIYIGGRSSNGFRLKSDSESIGLGPNSDSYSFVFRIQEDSFGNPDFVRTLESQGEPELYSTNLEDIRAYPNPFHDKLKIPQIKENSIQEVILYDKLGTILIEEKSKSIEKEIILDTSKLRRGIYFLKVFYADGNTKVSQVIKE
jgi:predicted Zn-dependent protease